MRQQLKVAAGCLAVLTGCSGGDGSGGAGPLREIRVSPEKATVVSQESQPLSVEYSGTLDVLGLIWYSDNTRIARVVGDGPTSGHVIGLIPGTTTIWRRTANDIHFVGPEGETLHGTR